MVSSFKGSVIVGQEQRDFDTYRLPLGPPADYPTGNSSDKFKNQKDVDGKITRTMYVAPRNSSPVLVYRSYEDALKQAGFQMLFSCAGPTCKGTGALANYFANHWRKQMGGNSPSDDARVSVAQLSRPSGDVYVSLCSTALYSDTSRVYTFVDVIETKPMAGGLVSVNAAAMASDISKTGHASIYGIYFDTGKADLKPESSDTLSEISKLLAGDAVLKLYVVGHTDNVGTFAFNMTLSKQRADAVVAALVSKYHVAVTRLDAAGVGPLAPVGSNDTDDGRAKNRRVELVKQ
jgi:outer membrane protein OmpA-like peptidoglycan-associated protein